MAGAVPKRALLLASGFLAASHNTLKEVPSVRDLRLMVNMGNLPFCESMGQECLYGSTSSQPKVYLCISVGQI